MGNYKLQQQQQSQQRLRATHLFGIQVVPRLGQGVYPDAGVGCGGAETDEGANRAHGPHRQLLAEVLKPRTQLVNKSLVYLGREGQEGGRDQG